MSSIGPFELTRYENGVASPFFDEVAAEEPLEIRVEGQSIAVIMRTPGHDRELAAGFLLSEGIVKYAREIFDITACVSAGTAGKGNVIDVALADPSAFDASQFSRHVLTSSSCGICGSASIERALRKQKPLRTKFTVEPELILSLPRRLLSRQEAFHRTGGLHACALFSADGKIVAVQEDIGRHNALDKVVGWALLEKLLPLDSHLILLSGRVSFEMMVKARAAGIPIVAAISAPSSMAVDFARESGQTLAGFVRRKTMNIYVGAQRIKPIAAADR